MVSGEVAWDLRRPADFDETAKLVTEQRMRDALPISADFGFHRKWIEELLELDLAELHLHQVGRNQRHFIESFSERVLPKL